MTENKFVAFNEPIRNMEKGVEHAQPVLVTPQYIAYTYYFIYKYFSIYIWLYIYISTRTRN